MKRVAAFVVDRAFDGQLLGRPEVMVGLASDCWLRPGDCTSLAGEMAERGLGFGAETVLRANELVRQYEGMPVRLLVYFHGIRGPERAPLATTASVATRLFSIRPYELRRTPMAGNIRTADNHIHGGLAFDVGALYAQLVRRVQPLGVVAVGSQQVRSGQVDIDLPLALAVLRWASWLFLSLQAHGWKKPAWCSELAPSEDAVRLVHEGLFWPLVREACISPKGSSPIPATAGVEMLRALDAVRPGSVPDGPISAALFDCVADDHGWLSDPTSWQSRFVVGLIRLASAVYGGGVARKGDGLALFQERVAYMGLIKKLTMSGRGRPIRADGCVSNRDPRSDALLDSLDRMAASYFAPFRFDGCELRQNIHDGLGGGRSARIIVGEIRDSVASAWRAFEGHLATERGTDGGRIRFCTPIGFQRIPSNSRDVANPNPATPGVELAEAIATANAVRNLERFMEPSVARRAIGSFDVSGSEVSSQNWPYCATMGWFDSRSSMGLRFTAHSGESFMYRMRGLRMIGETFLGEVVPARIGHGLALSSRISRAIEAQHANVRPVKLDVLADICWLHTMHEDPDVCLDLIAELVRPANRLAAIPPETWVSAFRVLHSRELVERVALFMADEPSGPLTSVLATKELWMAARPSWPGGRDEFDACYMFAWGDYDGFAAKSISIGECLDADLERRALGYLEGHLDDVEDRVKGLLRDAGTIIEVCPTSNLSLAGLQGYSDHPVWDWIREGLSVSISADDPLVFLAYGGDELARLQDSVSVGDFERLQAILASLPRAGHAIDGPTDPAEAAAVVAAFESIRV